MQTVQTMTVDGQEALFIPAGGGQTIINQHGQQIQLAPGGAGSVQLGGGQVLGQVFTVPKSDGTQPTFITPQGTPIQFSQPQQATQAFVTPSGQIIRAPVSNMMPQTVQLPNGQTVQVGSAAGGIPQVLQIPMATTTQTVPIQLPVNLANGQTVYQTFNVPVQLQNPAMPQFFQPQMQFVPQMPQVANVITPNGQIQQIQLTPISSLGQHLAQASAVATSQPQTQQHSVMSTPTTTTTVSLSQPSLTTTVSSAATTNNSANQVWIVSLKSSFIIS